MTRFRTFLACAGLCLPGVLPAAVFDGSQALLCASQQVNECIPGYACTTVLPVDVNFPDFFTVDAGARSISGQHGDGIAAHTPVERLEHLDGKLILQGADDGSASERDGTGWTLVINETSGRMLMTVAGDGFVVVVSGACMQAP